MLSPNRRPLAVLAAVVLASAATAAPAKGSKAVKGATVEGITEYSLPNGLRVLLFPDPSKPTVTVNVTYFVGSRHENYGETGMAHLFEHLLFKGTPTTPDVPQALTDHGASANGTTWFDRTNYYETVPATSANLDWAIRFEADRMVNSFIAKKDLDSEMTVVRNEMEIGENDPAGILMQRSLATAFLWHNYGNDTIGARSDVENVPIERLKAFYKRYYQPDNAMLVVAGRFEEAKALRLIEDTFGRIPRPARAVEPTWTSEPTQDGERAVTLRRVGDVQGLAAVYHVPAGSHEDFAAIDLLAEVLGSSPSGRLHKALVEPKKAASVSAGVYQLKDPGALLFSAEVRKDQPLDEAREIFVRTIEGVAAKPPTSEEVERARASQLKRFELTLNNSERVSIQLSEWAAIGDWRMMFLHRDRIRKATAADVLRVAKAFLKPSNRTLGVFIPTEKPDRSEIPATPNVAELVKDYKGDPAIAQGEAFDATPEVIDSRTVRTTLPSGFKLALLSKKTRGQTVNAQLNLRYGTEQLLAGKRVASDLAAKMLLRGTRKHTREQIKDELDRLKARVVISSAPGTTLVGLETVRGSLPQVLALIAEVLREPAFDARELEQLREAELADAEAQKADPNVLGFRAISRKLNPRDKVHPAYVPMPDEQIAELKAAKLEDARAFHADFYGASNGELALVGDFDVEAVTKQAGELFGAWKSPRPFERIANPYRAVAASTDSIDTPDKANAAVISGSVFSLRDDEPEYPALMLADYLLGGGFLNSRLATRLRQKEGLSYAVGTMLQVSSQEQRGVLFSYAAYAPQYSTRVESALREELARAVKDGFTADEVTKASAGLLQERRLLRAYDGMLSATLASATYLGRTMAFDAAVDRKLAALKPAEVLDAMRKHLDLSKLVLVKVGDFASAKPAAAAGPTAAPAQP